MSFAPLHHLSPTPRDTVSAETGPHCLFFPFKRKATRKATTAGRKKIRVGRPESAEDPHPPPLWVGPAPQEEQKPQKWTGLIQSPSHKCRTTIPQDGGINNLIPRGQTPSTGPHCALESISPRFSVFSLFFLGEQSKCNTQGSMALLQKNN
jgi:hypothetical protein